MAARFPFPSLPRGWFVIGFPSDIAPGEVKTVHYFGEDIVLFRTAGGTLSAFHKTCPHLGAHLGLGKVEGECLRCPFHHWSFHADGTCANVPHAAKIPPKAVARRWEVREQNDVIFAWYCPRGEPPTWEPPVLADEGWTPARGIRWQVRSHPQEVTENTVDSAHLFPVHHVTSCEVISVEPKAHDWHVVLHMQATGEAIGMPDEQNDVELDVHAYGVGIVIADTHVLPGDLRTRQRIYPTPIDTEQIAIFGVNNTHAMSDPGYTREIDDVFWSAFTTDFPRDFPIWETKAYVEKPILSAADGPIARYRKWARQFYDYPVEAAAPAQAAEAPGVLGKLGKLGGWIQRLAKAPPGGAAANDADDQPFAAKPRVRKSTLAAPTAQAHRFPSVGAYFDSLTARFDPGAAGDLDAVFQWVLTGEGARSHFAEVRGGAATVTEGLHPAPTLTIEMSAADYLLMINGELNGARAFSSGRGKLRGSVRLAMKMQRLFPLDRAV